MTIKTTNVQVGLSSTATQNFTVDASAANGTIKLARGNAGATTQDVLTVDASGNVNAPVGLQLNGSGVCRTLFIPAKATTSGTFIDFSPTDSTGIPSWAKRVTVVLYGVSTNGASLPQIQLGTSSGVETASYTCQRSTITTTAANSSVESTSGLIIPGGASSNIISGSMVLHNVTGNSWTGNGLFYLSSAAYGLSVGGKTLAGILDRIRLTTVNGTDLFDAGSMSILCEG